MRILVDFDNVIANTTKGVIDAYREITGDYSGSTKQSTWYFNDVCPLWDIKTQKSVFWNPIFFEKLELIDGAAEVLQILIALGHEVIISTSHDARGIRYKSQYIKEHLPFIKTVVYIDNGDSTGKSMVAGDMIIDDNIDNLKTSPCKYKICFGDYEYNKSWGERCVNWQDILMYIFKLDMQSFVKHLIHEKYEKGEMI